MAKQWEKRAVVKRRVLIHCIRPWTIHLPMSLTAAIEGTACVFLDTCVITLHFIGLNLRCKEQQPAGHLVVVTCVSHPYLVLLIEVSALSVFGVNTRSFNCSQLSESGKHGLMGSASQGPRQCLVPMTAPVRELLWETWYTGTLIYLHKDMRWRCLQLPRALVVIWEVVIHALFPIMWTPLSWWPLNQSRLQGLDLIIHLISQPSYRSEAQSHTFKCFIPMLLQCYVTDYGVYKR